MGSSKGSLNFATRKTDILNLKRGGISMYTATTFMKKHVLLGWMIMAVANCHMSAALPLHGEDKILKSCGVHTLLY